MINLPNTTNIHTIDFGEEEDTVHVTTTESSQMDVNNVDMHIVAAAATAMEGEEKIKMKEESIPMDMQLMVPKARDFLNEHARRSLRSNNWHLYAIANDKDSN